MFEKQNDLVFRMIVPSIYSNILLIFHKLNIKPILPDTFESSKDSRFDHSPLFILCIQKKKPYSRTTLCSNKQTPSKLTTHFFPTTLSKNDWKSTVGGGSVCEGPFKIAKNSFDLIKSSRLTAPPLPYYNSPSLSSRSPAPPPYPPQRPHRTPTLSSFPGSGPEPSPPRPPRTSLLRPAP